MKLITKFLLVNIALVCVLLYACTGMFKANRQLKTRVSAGETNLAALAQVNAGLRSQIAAQARTIKDLRARPTVAHADTVVTGYTQEQLDDTVQEAIQDKTASLNAEIDTLKSIISHFSLPSGGVMPAPANNPRFNALFAYDLTGNSLAAGCTYRLFKNIPLELGVMIR
jgi:hypothetical protein